MTLDLVIDVETFHAQVEIRYLPVPNQWVVSIRDHSGGGLPVNMIPLICSYREVNDLLAPFRFLREERVLALFTASVIQTIRQRRILHMGSLTEFCLVWGDTLQRRAQSSAKCSRAWKVLQMVL